jgi:sulfoxide reductase heme-binding subunit YedZ
MKGTTLVGRNWKSASIWLLYLVALLPAWWEFYLGAIDNLGADPVKIFEQSLGLWAVRFLVLTLAVSPTRDFLRLNLIRYRRALGLICFYYALMHFAVYLLLDQELAIHAVMADIAKRPFIMLGMTGLVLLVPLAVTSNALSIRVLGKSWVDLHRLIYVIAICGAIHLSLATKILSIEQWLYLASLTLLVLYRGGRPFLRRQRKVRVIGPKGPSTVGSTVQ